jgi:hypothetical protein
VFRFRPILVTFWSTDIAVVWDAELLECRLRADFKFNIICITTWTTTETRIKCHRWLNRSFSSYISAILFLLYAASSGGKIEKLWQQWWDCKYVFHSRIYLQKLKFTLKKCCRAAAHQLRQDKHQDMRQKRQKLMSASWLRLVCGGFHNLIRFQLCSFLCVMSQTLCLDSCRCAAYRR